MSVLVEAISVIVRRDAINRSYDGGWAGFLSHVPNNTLCADHELARVGFTDPKTVEHFINDLRRHGPVFLSKGKSIDIAVLTNNGGQLNLVTGWSSHGYRLASMTATLPHAGYLRGQG